ncbi:uncharacterized protein [Prorops nasuta]|uniref:uncharacterized protein n=1 Tax=Prorops nasuta TaxID=863751 RepID=UPI0034CEE874
MAPVATRKLILQQRDRANNISCILPAFRSIEKTRITGSLIRDRLKKLHSYWSEFCKLHEEIITRDDAIEDPYVTESFYANTESTRDTCNDELTSLLNKLPDDEEAMTSTSSRVSLNADAGQALCQNLHLPKIHLPHFTGKYEDWEAFENRFTSLIHNKAQLPNVVKLQYLLGCLRESAADFVKDVAVTDANYESTWNALKERVRMLGNLGRPVEQWDDLLVVIISERLDPVTRKAWETYLSTRGMHAEIEAGVGFSRKRPPTYKEIIDFLEGTIQALITVESESASDKASQNKQLSGNKIRGSVKAHHSGVKSKVKCQFSNAANSNTLKCPLCNMNHYIGRCDNFKTMKSTERHNEIRRLGLCFNCLGRHQVRNGNSKRGCKKCQGNHHTLLHNDNYQDRPTTSAKFALPSEEQTTSKTD